MSLSLSPTGLGTGTDPLGSATTLTLQGALEVRQAAAVRGAVREFLDRADPARPVTVDLRGIDALDAAGLAAVTSPVLAACRSGRTVSVVSPIAAEPRRLADLVGILPIGPC